MSTDFAAKLGFSVGSLSASGRLRTLIAEFSNTVTVEDEEGRSARYGVAARLVVGATSFEGKAALSIPMLAAEAQLGRTQASVSMTVNGYNSDKLAQHLPTDIQTLNVDTYSALTTKMSEVVTLIGSDRENIQPMLLWVQADDEGPAAVEGELTRGVAMAYALTQLKKHKSLDESLSDYHDTDDTAAQEAIRHVYGALLGDDESSADRLDEAAAKADRLLDRYVVRGGGLFG
jgi:hypothetical protein